MATEPAARHSCTEVLGEGSQECMEKENGDLGGGEAQCSVPHENVESEWGG